MSQYTKGSPSIEKKKKNCMKHSVSEGEIEGHLACEKSSTEASLEYRQSIEYIRNISRSAKIIKMNEKINESFLVEVQPPVFLFKLKNIPSANFGSFF